MSATAQSSSFTIIPRGSAPTFRTIQHETVSDPGAASGFSNPSLLAKCLQQSTDIISTNTMNPVSLLQDWKGSMGVQRGHGHTTSRSIRASPFEPLIHHRNLPKQGTISPLHMDEYYMWNQADSGPVHPPSDHICEEKKTADDEAAHPPPVSEIRIPTPEVSGCAGSVHSNTNATPFKQQHPLDYEQLYLDASRDLHHTQSHLVHLSGENRHLKRQLIELQRQLFHRQHQSLTSSPASPYGRSQSTPVRAPWSIPGEEEQKQHDNVMDISVDRAN